MPLYQRVRCCVLKSWFIMRKLSTVDKRSTVEAAFRFVANIFSAVFASDLSLYDIVVSNFRVGRRYSK
jgi:hypothetical protein